MILRDVPTNRLEQTAELLRQPNYTPGVQFFAYSNGPDEYEGFQTTLEEIENELRFRNLDRRLKFLENYRNL